MNDLLRQAFGTSGTTLLWHAGIALATIAVVNRVSPIRDLVKPNP